MLSFWIDVKKKANNINPVLLAITLFMIFLLISLATYNWKVQMPDKDIAEYLNNPLRVINGELPYRDFWLVFPPGEVLFPAFIYKIFGLNINIPLIFSVIINALVGLFSFLLGKSIFKDNFFAMISALLVFFLGIPYRYLGYTYLHLYFLLLLIATLFFMRYLKNNAVRELFSAGIFIGLAFLFRFYEVGATFLAIILTIFINSKINKKPFRYSIKSIVFLCSGVLPVITIVSLALSRIWLCMVREVVIESLLHGTSVYRPYFYVSKFCLGLIYADLKMMIESRSILYIVKILFNSAHFIDVMFLYLLPFFLLGISIVYLISKKPKKNDKIIVLFFLLWGIFPLSEALTIGYMSRLSQATTPLFFLLTFFFQKIIERVEENKYSFAKSALSGFIISIQLLVFLLIINRVYELTKPHYKVSTQYGRLLLSNESEAKDTNDVLDFINKITEKGDYIFVTADHLPYYALTNRRNPTYYDSLMDLVYRPSQEKQESICRDILKKNTKLIIHYPDIPYSGDSSLTLRNTCPTLERCIDDNFELAKKYDDYWIYVQKNKKDFLEP